MAIDLCLMVLDRASGTLVCERWLGGRSTLEAAKKILARASDNSNSGFECWANIQLDEAQKIAAFSYGSGATPTEVARIGILFPQPIFAWMIIQF